MKLAAHVTPVRLPIVLYYLCWLLRLLGILLAAPLAAAIILDERQMALLFGALAAAACLPGWLVRLPSSTDLQVREALVITVLAYLLFGLVGSLAFWPQASWIDAFFESMSGFTTTGLSVLDFEKLPGSLLFFRAYCQWIGGAGVAVLSLVLLAGPGRAGFRLFAVEHREQNLLGSVKSVARLVAFVYLALTVAGLISFLAAGLTFFDALIHILATVSTGGFSPYANSISHFSQPGLLVAVPVFMLLGAITFTLWKESAQQGLRTLARNNQLVWLLALTGGGWLLCLLLSPGSGPASYPGLFHAVSALTTTGFSVSDPLSWSPGVLLVTTVLMVIGGCTGSTAGGIKLYRLVVALKAARLLAVRALLPREAEMPLKYEESAVAEEEQRAVLAYIVLYLAWLLASALLLSLSGNPVWQALFESASSLGTVGLSAGVASPELAAWGKLILILNMWAGRIEVVPLLVLCYPYGWRRRER